MEQTVHDYCDTCDVCMRAKGRKHKPYGLLLPLQTPKRPWSSIGMDFVVELPESSGMTGVLVIVDRFTKMAHFVPVPGLPTAEATAELFINHVVRLHGVPEEVISDRGPQFVSHFWKRFVELLGGKICLSSAYHPQSDGQTERTNQTLEQYLRCFVSYQKDNWCSLLPLAEFAFNNTLNASTNRTPFYAYTGHHPKFDLLTSNESLVPATENCVSKLKLIHAKLKKELEAAARSQKKFADEHRKEAPVFKVGQKVWLDARNVPSYRPCPKLDDKWLGPYPIKKRINHVAYELELPPWLRIHPVFHVSLLEPFKENSRTRDNKYPQPPPIIIQEQEEYEVKEILDSKLVKAKLHYLIDWVGYPPSERCWVEESLVHAPAKIKEFTTRFPNKPKSLKKR